MPAYCHKNQRKAGESASLFDFFTIVYALFAQVVNILTRILSVFALHGGLNPYRAVTT